MAEKLDTTSSALRLTKQELPFRTGPAAATEGLDERALTLQSVNTRQTSRGARGCRPEVVLILSYLHRSLLRELERHTLNV